MNALSFASDIDECENVDCGGGGKCTDGLAGYSCSCPAGWRSRGKNQPCEGTYERGLLAFQHAKYSAFIFVPSFEFITELFTS